MEKTRLFIAKLFVAIILGSVALFGGKSHANLIVEKTNAPLAKFAEAKPTAITLQCGQGGVPTFVARIDLEAKIINVTFTDGDKDSAIILGERNGILLSKTSEGALLAFKGDQWALSVDGGQSAVAGGTCKQMVRV